MRAIMNPQQLRDMIEKAQAGDAQAYEGLLAAYQSRLYGYFYRATSQHHDAEDLLGELVLRLVRNLPRYDHTGRFEPWLFRMAANLVRDRIRRKKTRPTPMSLSVEDATGKTMAAELPATGPAVEAAAELRETAAQLHVALQKLDDTTRQMILLRHFGVMSFKEIASLFDCPLGTALARVHRGLRTLRTLMTPEEL
jgi:RNA polymerase sigma-70 factor (ECF subfamily)